MEEQFTYASAQRPLSPHLQIYRPQMSSVTSILHRVTGLALSTGSLLLVAWLWAAAYSPECFGWMHDFFTSIAGRLLLIGWTAAFYYHLCNGIRHLFWDIGKGFEIHTSTVTGWSVFAATLLLTLLTWGLVFADSVSVL
jgi:succinate dehydrogenase / fumarate reductase cytochrome b subunit